VAAASAPITVLAFDYGTRRIGVAVGNTLTRTARPLATVASDDRDAALHAIGKLVAEWQPQRLVVGLPVHADGTPHAMTGRAERFARDLEQSFHLPVARADERFTTQAAGQMLGEAGKGGRTARAVRDQVAAQLILEAWFDERTDDAA
jgi:putative Holliday junction resolvase